MLWCSASCTRANAQRHTSSLSIYGFLLLPVLAFKAISYMCTADWWCPPPGRVIREQWHHEQHAHGLTEHSVLSSQNCGSAVVLSALCHQNLPPRACKGNTHALHSIPPSPTSLFSTAGRPPAGGVLAEARLMCELPARCLPHGCRTQTTRARGAPGPSTGFWKPASSRNPAATGCQPGHRHPLDLSRAVGTGDGGHNTALQDTNKMFAVATHQAADATEGDGECDPPSEQAAGDFRGDVEDRYGLPTWRARCVSAAGSARSNPTKRKRPAGRRQGPKGRESSRSAHALAGGDPHLVCRRHRMHAEQQDGRDQEVHRGGQSGEFVALASMLLSTVLVYTRPYTTRPPPRFYRFTSKSK